jgi:hypothetical protein
MTERKQRIALRDLSTLSPEDKEMAEKNRIQGKIPNIFSTLVNHPKLARSWLRFAGYILSRQTLPDGDREIAILRIQNTRSAQRPRGTHTNALTISCLARMKSSPSR